MEADINPFKKLLRNASIPFTPAKIEESKNVLMNNVYMCGECKTNSKSKSSSGYKDLNSYVSHMYSYHKKKVP